MPDAEQEKSLKIEDGLKLLRGGDYPTSLPARFTSSYCSHLDQRRTLPTHFRGQFPKLLNNQVFTNDELALIAKSSIGMARGLCELILGREDSSFAGWSDFRDGWYNHLTPETYAQFELLAVTGASDPTTPFAGLIEELKVTIDLAHEILTSDPRSLGHDSRTGSAHCYLKCRDTLALLQGWQLPGIEDGWKALVFPRRK